MRIGCWYIIKYKGTRYFYQIIQHIKFSLQSVETIKISLDNITINKRQSELNMPGHDKMESNSIESKIP